MIYIGIDPGKGGGLAFLREGIHTSVKLLRFSEIGVAPMPDTETDIAELLEEWVVDEECCAVLEQVNAMPKQGVTSSFNFGRNYGFIRGCLISFGVPFQEAVPRKWMKGLGIRTRKKTETSSQWKNFLKGAAQQHFGNAAPKLTLKTCDALLIAEYCWRTNR